MSNWQTGGFEKEKKKRMRKMCSWNIHQSKNVSDMSKVQVSQILHLDYLLAVL